MWSDSLVPASRAAGAKAYVRAAEAARVEVRLDANEGPLSLLERIGFGEGGGSIPAEVVAGASRGYPDVSRLEAMLCSRLDVDASRLVVTAGGDDALCRICQAVIEPGMEAAASTPTFEMIPRYVRLAGGVLREAPWMEGAFPTDAMVGMIGERTRAVFVVTPNNPTGGVATAGDLERLSRAAGSVGALLVVDLAYAEFAEEDLTASALRLPNAVVVRTFSKAWGLAGLRVGYAIGPAEVISWLRAVGQPYAVSGPSAGIASWALENLEDAVREGVEQVKRERGEMTAILRKRGASVIESQGNFVLARLADPGRFVRAMASRGFGVRSFESRAGLEGWVRVTCPGERKIFERVRVALEAAI